jgi:hypothetical protein
MKAMAPEVHIFNSFAEADAADQRRRLAMTAEERVEVFLAIQQRGYSDASDQRLARVCRVLELQQS